MWARWLVALPLALVLLVGPAAPTLAGIEGGDLGGLMGWIAFPPIHVHPAGAGSTVPTGYSPRQIRHAYGFDQLGPNTGAGQIIAIVDAYDSPTVAADLQTFITQFSLPEMFGLPGQAPCTVANGPHPCFQKVFAQSEPPTHDVWAMEIALDTQWAHAIAPRADILLVEAINAKLSSLLPAVDQAAQSGATVVSMSWGGREFPTESQQDFHFIKTGVTFLASSGDGGTPQWPAASPNIVGVGGTSLPLDSNGNLTAPETAWVGSGGGISLFELEPMYQAGYPIPATGGRRGIPDVSYDADPATGVSVFDSTLFFGLRGWFKIGGTSVGTPQWAGLIAIANQVKRKGSLSGNTSVSSPLYAAGSPPFSAEYFSNYRDITAGSNSNGFSAVPGYDFVTGLGSPLANNLVFELAGIMR